MIKVGVVEEYLWRGSLFDKISDYWPVALPNANIFCRCYLKNSCTNLLSSWWTSLIMNIERWSLDTFIPLSTALLCSYSIPLPGRFEKEFIKLNQTYSHIGCYFTWNGPSSAVLFWGYCISDNLPRT